MNRLQTVSEWNKGKEDRLKLDFVNSTYTCTYNVIGVHSGSHDPQSNVITLLDNSFLFSNAKNHRLMLRRKERDGGGVREGREGGKEGENVQSPLFDNMEGWSSGQTPSLEVWTE